MSIPGSASPLFLSAAAAAAPAGYEIERSLRFNSADSAYLNRTFSAGNRKTWTWSGWVKKSTSVRGVLFGGGTTQSDTQFTSIEFESDDTLRVTGWNTLWAKSDAVFRDYSAWAHVVISFDSTQSTAGNQIKMYVNGQQLSKATENALTQNGDYGINQTVRHTIGAISEDANPKNDFYLADIHFIDGQALAPTDFGEYDSNSVWQPKAYSGTYGTNGFHLDFSDNSTAAALGTDTSGNSNTWTVNNLSVASGAGNDSLVDSPTNGTQTDTGAGGEVVGNYATLNPLDKNASATLTNGNLDYDKTGTSGYGLVKSTIAVSSSKWYCEYTVTGDDESFGQTVGVTLASHTVGNDDFLQSVAGGFGYYSLNGNLYTSSGSSSYGSPFTVGDTIGIALDMDNGKLFFSKNGVFQNSSNPALGTNPAASSLSGDYVFGVHGGIKGTTEPSGSFNFGQRAFAYTAPSGFKALCTANLPDPTIADGSTAMDAKLYTGNGSTQTISGLNFSPDFVWIKKRGGDAALRAHQLYDVVRGANKALYSNLTDAEFTDTDALTAFNSDGFSLGAEAGINTLNDSVVAWAWDGGTSTVSNTDGSITSSVRANASAGFSIVTWTGDGAVEKTVGHGLGVAPKLYIVKRRDSTSNWVAFLTNMTSGFSPQPYINLNGTAAAATASQPLPTSSVFYVQNVFDNINTATYVAYCFAPVAGYSAFGSYTGNGSIDGPFVYTGFRPRFLLLKNSNSAVNWRIIDAERNSFNVVDKTLFPNVSDAEATSSSNLVDFLSNGFKLKESGSGSNGSGNTIIYAAFAEHPFKYSRAR